MKKVVLCLVGIVIIVWGCIITSPMTNEKAVKRSKINIQKGYYCSGYHDNVYDGTRTVIFRNNSNEVVDSFEVSWSLAEKIYYKEV